MEDLHGCNVLYVDDELNNLNSFRAALRRHYNVLTAQSGEEGLRLCEKNDIQVVVTDQRMPGMTGVQFLQKLPKESDNIRIILTGFSDIEAIIEAINTGKVYRYITKPWDKDELKITIDNALETVLLRRDNKHLILELQEHNEQLEEKVKERTLEIEKQKMEIESEKAKSDLLLRNILPVETAEELKSTGQSKPKHYEKVSILFTDFVDFSKIIAGSDPEDVVKNINFYFSAFDEIISKYGLEKIKTIGDSYMCAGGLPIENESNPVEVVMAALAIRDFIMSTKEKHKKEGKQYFDCRIGVNTGPLVAGIVGTKKFAYDIWGDSVNIASRMEAGGEANRVNISGSTYALVNNYFNCTYRGELKSKHELLIDMYYVDKTKDDFLYVEAENKMLDMLGNQLPKSLYYHGLHHTKDVLNAAMIIASTFDLSEEEISLLRLGAIFHDAGFISHYKGHEDKGCDIAREILPAFGLKEEQVEAVCGMIRATKIPQQPKTVLEKIIADADLDYLGRGDVVPIALTLFEELKANKKVSDEKEWDAIQIGFLKSHEYHTNYALQNLKPNKQKYLDALLLKWKD